ncbi:MAG: hypothetical protein PVJ21_04630 [Anaerolineales bacterium]|jgi:hypothetical protein
MKRLFLFLLTLPAITGLGCSLFNTPRPIEQIQEEPPIVVTVPVVASPISTSSPFPEAFSPKETYQDMANNFEFDYPTGWAFDDGEQHSRGYYVQFYSWDWQPGDIVETTPVGETILSVTVNYWDPKNDLEAFVNQRKTGWDASGIVILSEERIILDGERPAAQFMVQGADGAQAFFLFTTIGEQYLTFSGNGNLSLLADIAHTLRPIQ